MVDNQRSNENHIYGIALLVFDILTVIAKFWFCIFESIVKLFKQQEPQDVKGEIVLVTGAGHGIGKEIALEYAGKGAIVVCWDINEKGNQETVKEIISIGGKAFSYVCDVTKRDEIFQVAEKVKNEVGFVSILVNNAGIMPCHPLLQHNEKETRLLFDINVLAHFWMIQAFVPDMIEKKKGHIIALSSCAGLFGLRNLVPYCGTKFAVRGVMEAFSDELRSIGLHEQIKLTTIYPYMVDTGLCKKPRFKFSFMKMVPPHEVAKAIVSAQRRGVEHASIPGHFILMQKIGSLFPKKSFEVINDFLDAGVNSDI